MKKIKPKDHTPKRYFRLDDRSWQRFRRAAKQRGTTASQALRDMIENYTRGTQK